MKEEDSSFELNFEAELPIKGSEVNKYIQVITSDSSELKKLFGDGPNSCESESSDD